MIFWILSQFWFCRILSCWVYVVIILVFDFCYILSFQDLVQFFVYCHNLVHCDLFLFTTIATVTTIIVKYNMLLLYWSKRIFFTKDLNWPTDGQTNKETTRLLELLGAAKKDKKNHTFRDFIYTKGSFWFLKAIVPSFPL